MKKHKVLLDEKSMERALARIAHEIIEKNKGTGGLVLLGVPTRGWNLAVRLMAKLKEIEGAEVPTGTVDATLYRDDIGMKETKTLKAMDIPVDIDDKTIVIVDDVLFTGRTIRAALNAIMDFGRPKVVQLAVLVDRGHRELPIRPDYVGKNVPTSVGEDVRVHLKEVDDVNEVVSKPREESK